MRALTVTLIFACFLSFTLVVISAAAPGAHGPDGQHLSVGAAVGGDFGLQADGSVKIAMAQQRALLISTQLTVVDLHPERSYWQGRIEANPQSYSRVLSRSRGVFVAPESGFVSVGQRIEAGQVLGAVTYQDSAFEQASQLSELIEVRTSIDLLARELNWLSELNRRAEDSVSAREIEILEIQIARAKEQERELQQGLETPEFITAPISGIVTHVEINPGSRVSEEAHLFTIIDMANVQLQGVRFGAAPLNTALSAPMKSAELIGFPGASIAINGTLPFLVNGLPAIQANIATNHEPIAIGSLAQLVVHHDAEMQGIAIPARSVVRDQNNQTVVWIKESAERFVPQRVSIVRLDTQRYLITEGLSEDSRVVDHGAAIIQQIR
ncbi:efflux RND transporter periplasmic adaptor subunit [Aliidiomarina sp.]|uniref:efflux RND transporter periplasmic adaptor subunit n=1 Tax=Aliidiomarina sp. TaxID=1872439 RepID=UPI003A4E5B08